MIHTHYEAYNSNSILVKCNTFAEALKVCKNNKTRFVYIVRKEMIEVLEEPIQ